MIPLILEVNANDVFPFFHKKLKEYFPIAEVGLLQEDSSNILQLMETAFEVKKKKKKPF